MMIINIIILGKTGKCMGFCPLLRITDGVLSVWGFVLWGFVSVGFCPVGFCQCKVLSCGVLSDGVCEGWVLSWIYQ